MEVIGEMRKPIEDMSLDDHKDLPELKRIEGLRLSGEAFANILMTYEFLHNFGETLGFEMDSLPTMDSLQVTNALSFYRSQNVLCRSKLFEPAQKFNCI